MKGEEQRAADAPSQKQVDYEWLVRWAAAAGSASASGDACCKRSASDSGDACGKRSATGQRAIARAVRPAEAGLLWTESAPAQRKTGEHKRCEGSVTYAPHTDASSARAVLVRQAPPPLRRCSAPKNTTCRPFATGVRARPCWAVAHVLTTWLPCGRITSCECLWRS